MPDADFEKGGVSGPPFPFVEDEEGGVRGRVPLEDKDLNE